MLVQITAIENQYGDWLLVRQQILLRRDFKVNKILNAFRIRKDKSLFFTYNFVVVFIWKH